MPKLIYFYVSDGARAEGAKVTWRATNTTTNRFAVNIANEGMFQLWDKLVEKGVFAHAYTFIDSMRGTHGKIEVTPRSTVFSVPHLEDILYMIDDGDVVVARGGFKPWYNVLTEINKRGNWVLFYRANTNRNPWPFWDVVLNDLTDRPGNAGGRLHFNFSKPTNENLFYRDSNVKKKYDVLLNASHIHVKKGQHRFIRAAIKYRAIYKKDISICLPGGFIRSWAKDEILNNIEKYKLDVHMPGGVPREQLNILMNESRLYVHVGAGGQNDRGCLEAMRCGLPVLISNFCAFAPFIYGNLNFSRVVPMGATDEMVAEVAHDFLSALYINSIRHDDVAAYYSKFNGMGEVIIPKMTGLFNHIFEIGKPDRKEILRRYHVEKTSGCGCKK